MAFCMTMLTWLAWNGRDNSDLHKNIAEGCFYLMGFLTLFYVLGANVDNVTAMLPFLRGGAQPPAAHVPLGRDRGIVTPPPARHPAREMGDGPI